MTKQLGVILTYLKNKVNYFILNNLHRFHIDNYPLIWYNQY